MDYTSMQAINSRAASACGRAAPARPAAAIARRVFATSHAKRAAATAAAASAASELDVGNVVFLEHVNLEVPDLEVARLFYGEGLGLTQDPDKTGPDRGGLGVVWYNWGRQQVHICRGPAPQTLPPGGAIGLVAPDVAAVARRLEAVQSVLGDVSVSRLGPGGLEARDPYGNAFVVSEPAPGAVADRGISHVLLPCHVGAAAGIADFYRRVLGARVDEAAPGRIEVVVGPETRLVFAESAALGARSDAAVAALHSGWHLALYIAEYGAPFERVERLDLVDNDHPFRDKCAGAADAVRHRQFRFRDVVALEPEGAGGGRGGEVVAASGGRLLYRLGHEVRSLHHPRFATPLYNRPGV